jgi:hypothetical protein
MTGFRRAVGFVVLLGVVGLFAGGVALPSSVASQAAVCPVGGGILTCPGGSAAAAVVGSSPGPFAVRVVPSGLAAGLTWGVTVLSATKATVVTSFITTNESQLLSLPRGTYFYEVVFPAGWAWGGHSSANLMFAVRGDRTLTVPFILVTAYYTWIFTERGLPKGTNWSVTVRWDAEPNTTVPPDLNGTEYAVGSTLRVAVYPGEQYYLEFGPVPGYACFGLHERNGGVITATNLLVTKATTIFHLVAKC